MAQTISDALSSFSRQLKRFNKANKNERVTEPTEDSRIQQQIRESGERFKASVVQTYKIYKSPFQALGQDSARAVSIDRDEQNLLKAYELYKAITEGAKEKSDEQTFIADLRISSPLAAKASYTDGGQFIYLLMWLIFEKQCSQYVPYFEEKGGLKVISFCPMENFTFDTHDKEVLDLVKKEFYGGE